MSQALRANTDMDDAVGYQRRAMAYGAAAARRVATAARQPQVAPAEAASPVSYSVVAVRRTTTAGGFRLPRPALVLLLVVVLGGVLAVVGPGVLAGRSSEGRWSRYRPTGGTGDVLQALANSLLPPAPPADAASNPPAPAEPEPAPAPVAAPAAADDGTLGPVAPPRADYGVVAPPSVSAALIDRVLAQYHSPAAGQGATFYRLGVQYGIDPAYALAFFIHESSAGTKGVARFTMSIGNIRTTPGYRDYQGYRAYETWSASIEDWYKLIKELYVKGWGLCTVAQILPRYAPYGDNNDPPSYIASVTDLVDSWQK